MGPTWRCTSEERTNVRLSGETSFAMRGHRVGMDDLLMGYGVVLLVCGVIVWILIETAPKAPK
jgi:hypothetical protein